MKNGPYEMLVAPIEYPGTKYRGRYVYEHQLVWWQNTKQLVPAGFLVHHKNEQKRDNRFDNLELTTRSSHSREHQLEKAPPPVTVICTHCGIDFALSTQRYNDRSKCKIGLFCTKSCSMKHQMALGIGGGVHDPRVKRDRVVHGTDGCYSYYKCRCQDCKTAHAKVTLERKRRKAIMSKSD